MQNKRAVRIFGLHCYAPRLYTDDTFLIVQHKNLDYSKLKVNKKIKSVSEWLNTNKLSLNIDKSHITLIEAKVHIKSFVNFVKFLSYIPIKKTSKYLGIVFDETLSSISYSKLNKKIITFSWIFSKRKPFLLNLYHAIFRSHLQYGLNAWSSTYKSFLKQLKILQNKAFKIVGRGSYRDRAASIYLKLSILILEYLVLFEKA